MESTTSTTAAHVVAATRALLDHIDAHGLPFPAEIEGPSAVHPTSLGVYVTNFGHATDWLASVVVDHEDNDLRGSAYDGTPYIRTVVHGRLPDTGVRVYLHVLRPVPLAVVGTAS